MADFLENYLALDSLFGQEYALVGGLKGCDTRGSTKQANLE
jgi:hypothetical protein